MTIEVVKGIDDKILRTVSKPVAVINADIRKFAQEMIKTMELEKGVGIAAPQVGANIRMVICKFNPGGNNEVIVPMVNPEILELSDDKINAEEGCLSLPGLWGKVKRSKYAIVTFKNLKNQSQTLELSGYNARIIQHEVDHINAILFADKATDLEQKAKKTSSQKPRGKSKKAGK